MRWKGRIPFESLEFDWMMQAEVFWRWRNLRRRERDDGKTCLGGGSELTACITAPKLQTIPKRGHATSNPPFGLPTGRPQPSPVHTRFYFAPDTLRTSHVRYFGVDMAVHTAQLYASASGRSERSKHEEHTGKAP
jgi:hypothetical protein